MEATYSYEKKKRLADRISKLKKKEDMIKIFEIIYQDNKNITENQNGLFMFFHTLDDSTYHKIDLYLRSSVKKRSPTDTTSESYSSYVKNEFPDQEKLNPKLKYSNREKNLIKRQRYDNHLNNESNEHNGVVYQNFDGSVMSDSESDKKSFIQSPDPVKPQLGKKKVVKKQQK
jgi:Bromodomain extra-terminal - transcription regulation